MRTSRQTKSLPLPLILTALVLLGLAPARNLAASAKPLLHPLFSDNAVLQRLVPIPVWGWAQPDGRVEVRLGQQRAVTKADASGKWFANLPALPAGGPHELRARSGSQTASAKNVMLGDVWICSGQSNMEQGISTTFNSGVEIAAADHPNIRLLTIPKQIAFEPRETFDSRWEACTPRTVSSGGWGGFSAVGYFFGRELHQAFKVPIGLIHTSWGGTVAEAWTSAEALQQMEGFRPALAQLDAMSRQLRSGEYNFEEAVAKWFRENDAGSKPGAAWSTAGLDTSDWPTMRLPAAWENAGLENLDGVVWFRREFDLPAGWFGKSTVLHLGPIDDQDTTWVNGRKVGETAGWTTERVYRLPPDLLVSGRNVITVRVLDTGGGGGLVGSAEQLGLALANDPGKRFALSGDWRYRIGVEDSAAAPMPRRLDNNPNLPTVLYNGMIAPLLPAAIKGAIWYQGESNAGRPEQYRTLLPTMIADWRSRYGSGDFPFLVVQLANFMARQQQPSEGGWALLREAQFQTAKNDPRTGMAVIIDIGETDDIHPRNKLDVGRRLALSARSVAYGQELVHSGPVYDSFTPEGKSIRLRFNHVGSGLTPQLSGNLTGFAIAGEDRRFVWADARIKGEEIVVSSPEVSNPVAVRYNWANNPIGNLYNKEGLPASSFRTDDWEGMQP